MISYDNELGVGSLTVDDFIGLTTDEAYELLKSEAPALTESEAQEWLDEINAKLDEIKDGLKSLEDEYEDGIDGAQTTAAEARYESKLAEVEEALDTLEGIEDAANDYSEKSLLLNITSTEDISWGHDTNELDEYSDGDVINIVGTGTGSAATMGLGLDDAEDEELTDTNGDGFITYADSEVAEDSETYFAGQDFFGTLNSGDHLTLISDNPPTSTFQLTTADGKTLTLNITGEMNLYWKGSDFVDLDEVRTWPEDLLRRCHDFEDTNNWYDRLFGEDMSTEERLSYMPSYEETISQTTFDSVWNTMSQATDGMESVSLNSSQVYDYYQDALNKLYGWVDDTSSTKESITAVWAEIFQDWTNAGLSKENASAIIHSLVMGVGVGADQSLFQTFFAPAISSLEGYLNDWVEGGNDVTSLDKTVMLMLENFSGATGALGGTAVWTTAGIFATDNGDGTYMEGEWKDNQENLDAISLYETFVPQMGWALVGEEVATAKETTQKAMEVGTVSTDGDDDTITFDGKDYLYGRAEVYADTSYGIWAVDEKCASGLKDLIDAMYNGGKPISVEDLRTKICNIIEKAPADVVDDLASIFIYMLGKEYPDILNQLCADDEGKNWKGKIWDQYINNSGAVPHYRNYIADEIWTEYQGEWAT